MSSHRYSTCSMQMEKCARITAARISLSKDACVMLAGCVTRLSACTEALKLFHSVIHARIRSRLTPYSCAFKGDLKRESSCSPPVIPTYCQRFSGPLLNSIDLHVEVPLVEYKALSSQDGGESSETIRRRVGKACATPCGASASRNTPPWAPKAP